MKTRHSLVSALLVLGTSAVASSALAATDWSVTLNSGAAGASYSSYTVGATATTPGVTTQGYTASSNSANLANNSIYNWGSGSGWGMYSPGESTSPNHALDNNGYKESLLLSFSTAVKLTSLTIGWPDVAGTYDSDMSVLAYMGSGTPVMTSSSYSTLISNGWVLVGQYANLVGDTATAINSSGKTSSYWLVAAYNSVFGTSGDGNCTTTTCSDSNDYVKVLSVAGNTPSNGKVPEPSPMALLGASLLGVLALRRRQKSEAS